LGAAVLVGLAGFAGFLVVAMMFDERGVWSKHAQENPTRS
jgi:hypothetical protein